MTIRIFNDRLHLEGPNWDGHFTEDDWTWVPHKGFSELVQLIREHEFSGGHGGDEYGNCTLYWRTPLFGVVWWYPTGHYQTDVEMTDPGRDKWIDRVYYGGCDEYCKHKAPD